MLLLRNALLLFYVVLVTTTDGHPVAGAVDQGRIFHLNYRLFEFGIGESVK